MAICPPPHADFTCAICLRWIERRRWGHTPSQPIPPVCTSCAHSWGRGGGGQGDLNPDRRRLRLVSALADALNAESHNRMSGRGPLYG